jgi:hypothetical protein
MRRAIPGGWKIGLFRSLARAARAHHADMNVSKGADHGWKKGTAIAYTFHQCELMPTSATS